MLCAPMAPTKNELPTTIIKSARSGREHYTQQYKDEVFAAYEASGMSGPAFADHYGLKYPTFASWAAKRRHVESQSSPPAGKQQFVLAEFGATPESGELHIELPGGASARLSDAGQADLLATLIRALT